MFDNDKLINTALQIEHNKEGINQIKGFNLYLFEALYLIQQYIGRYKFWDILFIIVEFIQLMAFPMNEIFDESWGNHWVKTIGNFFRYTQLISLFSDTSFFIIYFIFICVYILVFITLFIFIVIDLISFINVNIIKFFALMFQMQTILNIPFLRALFSIYLCKNDILEISHEIKCRSEIHIALIIISLIIIIIYKLIIIIFHCTLYEFGFQPNKLKSGYSSSTEVIFDLAKLILTITYQFISHELSLSIITLLISIILLINFMITKPYSNGFSMKLYFSLYSLFLWSCIICIISIFLKNSNFKSGIIFLLLGYPLILIIIYIKESDFLLDKLFSFYLSNYNDGYNNLLEIEYFLKLEVSLEEKIRTKELKLLFAYIYNHETKCTIPDCYLKSFMKIPFKPENIQNLKILLLQYAELLFKHSISKYPNNIKLRVDYILFLFKKINKKSKAKHELILLNKFETNLECSFLIYKLKKYINNIDHDKYEFKEFDNREYLFQNISAKEKSKKIISMVEKIINNYISFLNILLIEDFNKSEHFIKMSNLGEDIKMLNKELYQKIKSLDNWNLLDQETIKIFIQYLKKIINNDEKANIYSKKISEEEQNMHQYDEINLIDMNYKEMSKK